MGPPFCRTNVNEGIATYVGILLGRESGLNKEADATLARWINNTKRYDPEMTEFDLASKKNILHVSSYGQTYVDFRTIAKRGTEDNQQIFSG